MLAAEFGAGDRSYHLLGIRRVGIKRGNAPTKPQYDDAIGYVKDIGEIVANDDDA